jgi:hypothetical protein
VSRARERDRVRQVRRNRAAGFLPAIAFANNVYVGDVYPKIAYAAASAYETRPFFESFNREEKGTVPRPGRWVEAEATVNFIHDTLQHARSDRLHRAMAVRLLSRDVRDQTAAYIRRAILDYSGVAAAYRETLEAPPRDVPLRSFLTRYLWGEFQGDAADLALPELEYPHFE